MPATPSGADNLANTLLDNLTVGLDFTLPSVDLSDAIFEQPDATGELYAVIDKLENADLTSGVVGGTGTFDVLMTSLSAHLKAEYTAGRISGQEYTKAYIGVVQAALGSAVQYLLARDSAYWQAILVQRQARIAEAEEVTARINLEVAKASLVKARYDAETAEANYGLIKMKISTEDVTYAGITLDNEGKIYTQANILPKQAVLLQEQVEVQRAQTLDTRTDTAAVTGVLGKQKDLYSQQITSYQRDAETKVVKMFVDSWITQKTLDEGLLAPVNFQNTSLDAILTKLKTNLDLD